MKNILDGGIGIAGCLLAGISMENVSAWVSLICSLAIAITTCGIQVYRMIRDRDIDKKEKDKKEKDKE